MNQPNTHLGGILFARYEECPEIDEGLVILSTVNGATIHEIAMEAGQYQELLNFVEKVKEANLKEAAGK